MIETVKYWIDQFIHFPFDITLRNFNFYCYRSGPFFKTKFNNYTGTALASRHVWRVSINLIGYSFDLGRYNNKNANYK